MEHIIPKLFGLFLPGRTANKIDELKPPFMTLYDWDIVNGNLVEEQEKIYAAETVALFPEWCCCLTATSRFPWFNP